jgi:hypothetical protein
MVTLYVFFKFYDTILLSMIAKTIHKQALHTEIFNTHDRDFWLSQSSEDRLNAVEFLRKQLYGEYPERLQRVYTITERT